MASRSKRMDLREGESSRASQANSGLVMAMIMAGLLPVRGRERDAFTTQHIPVWIGGWSKNQGKKIWARWIEVILQDRWGNGVYQHHRRHEKERERQLRNSLPNFEVVALPSVRAGRARAPART